MSKKYTLIFSTKNPRSSYSFNAIKKGIKTVETRGARVRYNNIKAGDVLIFKLGENKFSKTAKRVTHFKSLEAMLKNYKVKNIMPGISSVEEMKKVYYSFPNYKEKIKKYGIIAFELK